MNKEAYEQVCNLIQYVKGPIKNPDFILEKLTGIANLLVRDDEVVPAIEYEGLYDEALDMARTLQNIDSELSMAAQCEGDYDGGYPPEKLLPSLCKLMYASFGYHRQDRYTNARKNLKKESK